MDRRLMGVCVVKRNASRQFTQKKSAHLRIAMALLSGACLTFSAAGHGATALPTGGVVAAGAATISQGANVMNINQTSQRAVINWSTFDVAKGNTVNFNQPNANASTLNRVNGANQSMINGAVNSNGQVVFVNPNGVVFGKGAEVNTGGLVATTMDVADSEFMAGSGKMQFRGNGSGQILNQGKLTVNNASAYIALMAPQVVNEGVVIANMSGANAIALVAGQTVTLTFSGNSLIKVNVDASAINALISNKRLIKTEGGQIIIAANSASDLRASVINNTGTISASSISTSGGTVSLVADTITQAGTVSANGGLAQNSSNTANPQVTNSSANGGNITLQGNTLSLATGSVTSAKGAANGGLINVGTTKVSFTQNADGTRSNLKAENLANTVTVEQNALVDASSVQNGNGGEINIWSQVQTNVAGILKALGGSQGGNGGFIETSSNGILNIAQTAIINVTAALGKVGMWLLDPDEMTITSSTATAISNAAATANVTISVSGNLNVAAGATLSSSSTSGTTLTLNASGSVTNNGTISMGENGAIVINATSVNLATGSSTSANQITATAQAISVNGSVSSAGGSSGGVTMLANGIVLAGPVSANGSSSSSSTSSSSSSSTSSGSGSGSGSGTGSSSSSSGSSGTTSSSSTSSSSKKSSTSSTSTPTTVRGVAAAVTTAANAAITNISSATSAATAVSANTTVVNLAASSASSVINSAIANATTASTNGTTTIINIAAGQVSGASQAAMSLTIAPNTSTATTTTSTQLASGGAINLQATSTITTTSAASVTADAAGSVSSSSSTTGAAGGSVNIRAYASTANLAGLISASSVVGQAGTVAIAANDLNVTAQVLANGTTGGSMSMIATGGNASFNNATITANGSSSTGGYIQIAAQNTNQLVASTVAANGLTQGGVVQIGINNPSNTTGSGSTLAPPQTVAFNNAVTISDVSSLDSQTQITANAVSSTASSNTNSQAGYIYIAGNTTLNTAATIQANADTGGLIILASPAGTYQNTGYIQTNGGAGLGGTITQSGLISTNLIGATVEANGTLGGGNIIIGRDFKTNPLSGSATQDALLPNLSAVIAVPTSASTTIDANSSLTTNSTISGDGGNVLVWGDGNLVAGTLSAKALGTSGNGGFIETSGNTLSIATSASVSAASIKGIAGTWLLDPYDLTVASSGGDVTGAAIQSALGSNNVTIQTNTASVTCTNVSCASGTSNLGDIYINDTIAWSSSNTLSLKAYNNIYVGTSTVGGSLTLTGTANLVLVACGSNTTCYASAAYSSPTSGVGYVLMGMASSPTSGLLTNQNGFNGQVLINSTGVTPSGTSPISINGRNYTVINSESAFTAISGSNNYVLGSDLTFTTSYTMAPVASAGNGAGISGNINGLGHKISGLSITDTATNKFDSLIGYMSGGSLSNIGVGGSISTYSTYGASGLVGKMYSPTYQTIVTIKNSYSSVVISGAAGASYIGGLVGQFYGVTANNIYATGNVTVANNGSYIGGLIGLAINSDNVNNITNAFATGTVTVGNGAVKVGGLIGDIGYSISSTAQPHIITNVYATGNVITGTGSTYVGGLFGVDWGNKINYVYYSGTVTVGSGSTLKGVIAGDMESWSSVNTYFNNGFYDLTKNPTLSAFGSYSGSGTWPGGLTTTQLSTSSNLTNFTFSSSAWGYAAVSNAPPVLCNFGGCSSYTHYVVNDTYQGASGGTWSTGTWSLGYAPTSSNTSDIGTIIIPTGITVIFDTANVGSLGNAITNSGTISFSGSSNVTLSGVISGAGSIIQAGGANITLSGANTYTGTTTVNSGTITAGVSTSGSTGAFGNGSNVTVNGGTLALGSYNETVGSVTVGNSGGSITGSGTLTATSYAFTNTSSNAATISAKLAGSGTVLTQSGSGTTTLSGVNTYSGGTTISAGTLVSSTSSSALGSGTVTLGASSGSANATLQVATTGLTYSNAIVLSSGTSGTLTIGNTGTSISTTFSGGVSGTNNLVISEGATNGTITFSGASINNTGTITNSGSGTGTTTISATVGSNVTGITESSSTSALTISGAITTAGTTFTNSGTAALTLSGGITGTGNVIFNNNSSGTTTVSTTSINNTGTITNSGSGTGTTTISATVGSNVTGITESSSTSALTISGAITPKSTGSTFTNSGTGTLTISGGISGAGNVTFNNNSTGVITVSTTSVNNTGTITNSGSGSGITTISAAVGSNVTSITESSSTSPLTLSGSNSYTGGTTITYGTINAGSGNALGTGGVGIGSSGILNLTYAGTVALSSTLSMSTGASITNSANTSSLSVAGTSTLNGSITTTGTQTYAGAVTLGANTALTTTNSNITFTSASSVDSTAGSYYGLSITNGTGTTAFGAAVGTNSATSALGYLCINSTNCSASVAGTTNGTGTTTLAGNVTTSGTQTYGGATIINKSSGLTLTASTNNGVVSFGSTVDSFTATNYALTINNGTGATSFAGAVGTTNNLGALTLNGTGTITLGGNVTTAGDQTYTGPVSAAAGITISANAASGASGILTYGYTSNSNYAFALQSAGAFPQEPVYYVIANGTSSATIGSTITGDSVGVLFYNTTNTASNYNGMGAGGGSNSSWCCYNAPILVDTGRSTLLNSISVSQRAGDGIQSRVPIAVTVYGSNTAFTSSETLTIGGASSVSNVSVSGTGYQQDNFTQIGAGSLSLTTSGTPALSTVSFSSNTTAYRYYQIAFTSYGQTTVAGSYMQPLALQAINLVGNSYTASTATFNGSVTASGALTISTSALTAANISAGGALTINNSGTGSVTGVISNNGSNVASLVKQGAGTLTLSGANTYTGGTTVSAGTVSVGADANLGGSGAINLNGGTLNISTGAAFNSARTINVLASSTINNADTSGITFTGNVTGPTVTGTPVTLTLTGANATTFSTGAITNGTGTSTVALVQNTTGTTTLSGSNSYTGGTTITTGTLKVGNGAALGNASGAVSVATLAALDLNGTTMTNANALTLNGTGISSGGALTNSSATGGTYIGAITLGSNSSIGSSNGNITASGIISGAFTLTKIGTDTLTLSGANTYTGLTTISAGTLKLGAAGGGTNTPLGTTGAGTLVSDGATLDLNGFTLVTSEALTLNGAGFGSAGALTNSSGTAATYAGLITLGSASTINASSGNIVISNVGTITGATFGLTLTGTNTASSIASIIGTTSGTLTKSGLGSWTVSGANTYTGLTTISAGTLKLGAAGGGTNTPLGTTGAGTLVSDGATLDLNGFTLVTSEALTLNGAGFGSAGALTNSSGTAATYAGLITLGSDTLMGSTAGAITVTGAIGSTASAYNLALVGDKAITLSSATNTLSTIASASGIGALSITNNQALTIGSMTIGGTTYSGLSSTGTILVQTSTGNLTVNNAVATTSTSAVTSAPAIKLAAGYNGTTSDTAYNIILASSSSSLITAGSGAIIALYSGAPTSSTNLSAFTAGQTTNFITYSKTTSDTQSATPGYYLKYRGTIPNLYVIFDSSNVPTYGAAPTIIYTFNTLANGLGTSYSSSDTATVNATGTALFTGTNSTTSTTGVSLNSSASAGLYNTVTYSSGLSSLFYAISAGSSTGTLTINKANAYVIINPGQTSTYGATPTINYTFNANNTGTGSVISASPTGLSGTATFTNTLTATSNAGTYSLTYASGLTSTNYLFAAPTSSTDYTISKANAYVIINPDQTSTYGATPTINYTFNANNAGTGSVISASPTGLSGTATFANTPTATSNAGTYSVTYASGLTSTNYAFNAAASSRSYTVNPAALNLTITKTYDGTTTFTNANSYTLSGTRYNSDAMPTITSGSAASSSANAATYTGFASNALTLSNTNYSLTGTIAATINPAPLGIVISGVYSNSTTITPTGTPTITGLVTVGGVTQTLVPTSVTVSSANVSSNGANYVTAINSKTGTANLSNYAITTAYNATSGTNTTNTVTLTGAPLGISVTGVYNGLYSMTPSSVSTVGLLGGQTITGLSSVTLNSKDVISNGANYVISASGVTGTANISNYAITAAYNAASTSTQNVVTLSAAPLGITVSGSYSGSAVIAPSSISITGLVNGETLTGLTSATLNSANVSANGANYVTAISGPTGTATLSNYSITSAYNASSGNTQNTAAITAATLTVTAGSSQKFVTESDPTGYGGVTYSGWVAGQGTSVLNTTGLTISRSTPTVNTAGTYDLNATGLSANGGNYTFTYRSGVFTIVPADTLAVVVSNTSTAYGTAPTYSITSARYLNSGNSTIYNLTPSVSGSVVTMSDGSGGSATFTLTPVSSTGASSITSGSGNYKVDSYILSATNKTIVSDNFSSSIVVTGALTVSSLGINPSSILVTGLSKTYDGTTNVSGLTLSASSTTFKTGDTVSVTGSGNFANANVGTGKAITISPGLTGTDASNYYLTGSGTISTTGSITQLASVTYTGTSGGNWSSSANWTGGATPTLSNVATVIIPNGKTVVYDAGNLASLTPTSAITDNGTLSFTGSTATTFANAISGTGSLGQSGTGALTLTGTNTYSGGITLASGSSLIAGSSSALGTGALTSSGGSFGTTSVTLPSLTINGAVTLTTGITTTGNQSYNGAVSLNNTSGTTTLSSSAGNINFASTINAGAASQSLVLSAAAGQVSFNGQVGVATQTYNSGTQSYSPTSYSSYQSQSSNNPTSLTVTANTINLNADISTGSTQTYNGALLVGDNGSNGTTRVLLSEDPAITFNGTINDALSGTHNLFVKAVTTASDTPTITFNGIVGGTAPLASLTVYTGTQDTSTGAAYSAIANTPATYVGTVTITNNVTTVGNQTYTTNAFALGDNTQTNQNLVFTSQSGDITFNSGTGLGGGFTPANGSLTITGTIASGKSVTGFPGTGIYQTVYVGASAGSSSGSGSGGSSSSSTATSSTSSNSETTVTNTSSRSTSSNLGSSVNAGALASVLANMPTSFGGAMTTGVEVAMSGPVALASNVAGSNTVNQSTAPITAVSASTSTSTATSNSTSAFASSDSGVTVQVQTPSGTITLQSSGGNSGSGGISGFSFTVPEAVIAKPADAGGNATGYVTKAQLADGSPLPSWLSFDSNTNTFTATQVPPNVDSVKILIQTVVGNQVVGTTPIEINPSQKSR